MFNHLQPIARNRGVPATFLLGNKPGANMQTQQQTARNLSARETGGLIGSDMVEGTAVYRPNGERIGTIERVMIDKRNGKVRHAVMSFGGFLGMGNDHYPIPWSLLVYNERLGGYEVGVSDEQLRGAPRFPARDPWMIGDRQNEAALYSYYGALPYW
jgi:hypothetical protein